MMCMIFSCCELYETRAFIDTSLDREQWFSCMQVCYLQYAFTAGPHYHSVNPLDSAPDD